MKIIWNENNENEDNKGDSVWRIWNNEWKCNSSIIMAIMAMWNENSDVGRKTKKASNINE